MPLYPKNQFQQWAEQEPSVVESPIMRGLRSVAKGVGAADPGSVLTTIGPNAIPLDKPKNYMFKVLQSVLPDVRTAIDHPPWQAVSPEADRIIGNINNPYVRKAMDKPSGYEIEDWVQFLSNVYHK